MNINLIIIFILQDLLGDYFLVHSHTILSRLIYPFIFYFSLLISPTAFTSHPCFHLFPFISLELTTGGGWQDQIGAIYAGFKIARSAASLPLTVTVEEISTTDGLYRGLLFISKLSQFSLMTGVISAINIAYHKQ